MSTDDIQRVLGQLENGIENLSRQHETFRAEHREDLGKIFKRLDDFPATCPTGIHLTKIVEELQKRPERIVGVGAAIASILGAMGSAFLWALGRGH